jgi:hypothetical protein
VLYLDRPVVSAERGLVLAGRFGYSDLKEAALSGAAGLWVLNRLELVMAARDVGFVAF